MQCLIFTTMEEGKIKLTMLKDIADGLSFPCIYYNGRQPLLAIQAIKAQSCKTTDARINKNDHMFSNTHRKIREENNLPPKLSRCTRNRIPPKSGSMCHPVHHKIRLRGSKLQSSARKHCNNISILSCTNLVQLSKATGSCGQNAKILVVTAEFRMNNLPLIIICRVRNCDSLVANATKD